MDVSKWFNMFSFDAMGDLGFGASFDNLSTGEFHWAIPLLGQGMDPLGFCLPQWLFRVLVAMPGLSAGYHKFVGFCTEQLDARIARHKKLEKGQEGQDIIQYLIDQYNDSPNKADARHLMTGDSRLIIVAGSDTTAAALVHTFYWLAKKPELQQKLRQELKVLNITDDQVISDQRIKKCEYLNGILNEAMRLNPPVPSGVFRKTPKEGIVIGETFIPGDAVIQMPHYAMGHGKPFLFLLPPFHLQTHPRLLCAKAPRRSPLLHRPRIFHSRTLVLQARAHPPQRRLHTLLYRALRLHRQESGVYGDEDAHGADCDEV